MQMTFLICNKSEKQLRIHAGMYTDIYTSAKERISRLNGLYTVVQEKKKREKKKEKKLGRISS